MQELRQFDKAIEVFKQALEINPLHASAEFGLARALQRTGHTAGGEGTIRAFSAFDEHKDFVGARAVVWRAGTLFDGDRGRRAADDRAGDDSGAA